MNTSANDDAELLRENTELRARLEESEEILRSIRAGEVDALVMSGQVYTIQGAETPYRTLVESIHEGAATLTEDGAILFCNRCLAGMLRIPLECLMGASLRQFVAPADQTAFDTLLARGKHGSAKGELNFQVREVPAVPVRMSFSRFNTQDACAVCVVATDLTESKQAEQTQVRLAAIVESSEDAIIGKDLDGGITNWNKAAEKLFGFTPDEVTGTSIMRLIPAHLQDEELQILDRIKRGESVRRFETVRQTKDGRRIDVAITASPIKDATGKIIGVSKMARDITERKRAEEALRLAGVYNRSLIEASLDPLVTIGASGKITDVNAATEAATGCARAELIGTDFSDYFTEPAKARAGYQRAFHDGFVRDYSLELRHRDGRTMTVLYNASVYRDEHGEVTGVFAAARDITERKRMEETLRREQELFDCLVRTIPDCIYFKDRQSRFVRINDSMARRFGLRDPAEAVGKTDFDIFSTEHSRQTYVDEQRAMETGEPIIGLEEKETWPDGRVTWASTTKVPLRDAEGKVTGLVGISRDITERKRAEESHARLATVVEQAAESILITDTQGAIQYVNPAFEKTSGYTCAEAVGQTPRMLKSGRQDAGFYRRMWAVITRGETWVGHLVNRRKDGTLYEEEATISPVRDAASVVVNYVAIKRDVTHEVQLEAQYRQSQKMEAFGQLAGGVAHDFNNILAVIQLHAELLRIESNLTLEQLEYAGEIGQAAVHAANLTRQLLLFSRKQTLQPRNLKLNDLVANITRMLQRTLGEQIQLQFKLSSEPLFIHADPGMIDQILLNLTVNARDAMPKGGQIVIETSAVELDESAATQSPQARPGSFVCVSVSDNGCGIPPEILPRIFEPFFTTKEVGKGTGLGLATVFGIVQQHQGWINVCSTVGRGTTFRVYLPRKAETSDTDFFRSPLAGMPRGNETILLVEDESAVRDSMRKTLSQLGYGVLEASTGTEALEVWKQNRNAILLLLTDLVMPGGMTGRELAQRLLQENPKMKVIYTSGYSAGVAGDLSLEEGVNFLAKPFQTHQLAKVVRNNLDKPAWPKPETKAIPGIL